MEEWRDIPGYEGRYQISSHGRVRSCARTVIHGRGVCRQLPELILKKQVHYRGYEYIIIRIGPIKYKHFIHRLVAVAFHPNPEGKPFVNHRNRNQLDNHMANLEWVTEKENTDHWREHDKQGLKVGEVPIPAGDLPW